MNPHRLLLIPLTFCLATALQAKEKVKPSSKPAVTVPAWPANDEAAGFTIEQTGDDRIKDFTVTEKATGKKIAFTCENRGGPRALVPHNGWPQIELFSDGPPEFLWRRLYRMDDGAYHCVRIDELTRQDCHAPADAPTVALGPRYKMKFLRSRETKEGDAESFEKFTTETPSPDGKTIVRFNYEPHWLNTVEITSETAKDNPQVIYNLEEVLTRDVISSALWRPDSGAFVFYVAHGPRLHSTTLFLKKENTWEANELPDVKLPLEKGWNVEREFVEPIRWTDARTLVLFYSGDYQDRDGDVGSYYFNVTLRWGKDGKASTVSVKRAANRDIE